jgi:hypothetical protein
METRTAAPWLMRLGPGGTANTSLTVLKDLPSPRSWQSDSSWRARPDRQQEGERSVVYCASAGRARLSLIANSNAKDIVVQRRGARTRRLQCALGSDENGHFPLQNRPVSCQRGQSELAEGAPWFAGLYRTPRRPHGRVPIFPQNNCGS